MKKIIFLIIVILIGAVVLIKLLSRPSQIEIASKAELQADYAAALENYVKVVLDLTDATPYPDKDKAITATEEEWIHEIEKYIGWITYSIPDTNKELSKAIDGIVRCTSYIENENYITEKKPTKFVRDSLTKEWRDAFFRKNSRFDQGHDKLISRSIEDSLSFLHIRAMTGYIYNAKFLDLKTGKRTDFLLYPHHTVLLLVRPGEYFLICLSEVQFTEGLSGKTWRSPENIIPISVSDTTSLRNITIRTKVSRKK